MVDVESEKMTMPFLNLHREKIANIKNKVLSEIEIYCLLIILGFWYLTSLRGALSCDEIVYAQAGYSIIKGNIYVNLEHPPLVKYFIGIGQLIFGTTSFAVRFPIVILGLLTIYTTYQVGKLLHGRFAGFISAFLLGGTYFFASHLVSGMLDVPLAFFAVTLLFITLKCIKTDNLSQKHLFFIGFLSVCAIATKYYGVFFAIIPLGYLIIEQWKKHGLSYRLIFSLKYYIMGGLLSFVLVYSPYFFISHPPMPSTYHVPIFIDNLLNIPIFGNFVYVFGYSFLFNLEHLAGGHLAIIGGTLYQYPPFWAYLYWLYIKGSWIYTLGLLISLCCIIYDIIKSRGKKQIVLISFILFPLLCFNFLNVKMPRYLIPLFPIIAVYSICCIYKLLIDINQNLPISKRYFSFKNLPRAILIVIILLVVLTPDSPLADSIKYPINTDSNYDQATKFVKNYAESKARELVVLSFYPHILKYYLEELGEGLSVNIIDLGYHEYESSSLSLQMINEGKVDIVIDFEDQPRFCNTELYRNVRDKAKSYFYFGQSGLAAYIMK